MRTRRYSNLPVHIKLPEDAAYEAQFYEREMRRKRAPISEILARKYLPSEAVLGFDTNMVRALHGHVVRVPYLGQGSGKLAVDGQALLLSGGGGMAIPQGAVLRHVTIECCQCRREGRGAA